MKNFIDIPIGTRFGHLVVLEHSDQKSSDGKRLWKCQCDCGTICYARSSDLRAQKKQTCGCRSWGNKTRLDLTGKVFGELTVLEKLPDKIEHGRRYAMWRCKCNCGKEIQVSTSNLRSGNTKSCGCYGKSILGKSRFIDHTNERFGKLVAIKYHPGDKNHVGKWECKCDCGNIVNVKTYALVSENTQSCGCMQSKGEYAIIQLLTKNNIPFVTQKKFDSCFFPDTKQLARFDFYINNEYLIEYDGAQHFKVSGWTSKEDLVKNKYRDSIKNQWCKENNIPLIRIPYTHLNDLTIDDLILERSKFIWQQEEETSLSNM